VRRERARSSAPDPGATAEERKHIPLLLQGLTLDRTTADTRVGSMGSCTTNSVVAPIVALHEVFGVAGGLIMSVHSATNSDSICDTWASRGADEPSARR
jgi:glyceraldehyde-3-phosphate dehydrogenase/erythrose-4-phosphate dehydrogenase